LTEPTFEPAANEVGDQQNSEQSEQADLNLFIPFHA